MAHVPTELSRTSTLPRPPLSHGTHSSDFRFPQLQWLADSNIIGLIIYDSEGSICSANDKFLEMLGYTREDLEQGKIRWTELTPPEWLHLDFKALEQLRETGVMDPIEKEYIRKDGSRIFVRACGTPWDETFQQGVAYIQDISAQHQAELEREHVKAALAESQNTIRHTQERLSLAILHARVGFYDWDIQKNQVLLSERMRKDWGIEDKSTSDTLEKALGLIHIDDRERVNKLIQSAVSSRLPYHTEYRVVRPNGEVVWVDVHGSVIYDAAGTPMRFFGTSIDITQRKEQEVALKHAATAVFNERENFRALFMQTPEMVCILRGKDHVFEFVNEAHVRALGFDATGMTVRQAQPESVEVHGILDEVYRTGTTAELSEIPVTLTDRLRYFNLTYAARRNEKGEVDGIMILGVEITDQVLARQTLAKVTQQAQENFAKLHTVVHQLSEGVFFGDKSGNIILVNSEALRIHGFSTTEEMVRMLKQNPDLFTLWTTEGRRLHRDEWPIARATRGEKFSDYEIEVRRTDKGTLVLASYGGAPVYDENGEILLVALTIRDITEKRNTEHALQKALRSRDEFLSIASHELKTPITALKLQAQIALRLHSKGQTYTEEEVHHLMELIERQADRLNRLVDDMLDIAHMRSGKLNIQKEPVRLDKIVSEAVQRFDLVLKQAGTLVTYHAKESIEGEWDHTRLEQVITNLLTNAMRYGQRKPIEVRLFKTAGGQTARLEVRDQGKGIDPASLERIFNRFERAVDVNEISGLGLGLYITRQIVEAHGGRIWAESDGADTGSTFIVELPTERRLQ